MWSKFEWMKDVAISSPILLLIFPSYCNSSSQLSLQAFVPERSKGFDSSSNVFVLVGSNPTECNSLFEGECKIGAYSNTTIGAKSVL